LNGAGGVWEWGLLVRRFILRFYCGHDGVSAAPSAGAPTGGSGTPDLGKAQVGIPEHVTHAGKQFFSLHAAQPAEVGTTHFKAQCLMVHVPSANQQSEHFLVRQ
jgi:hypothetical protein